MGDTASHRPDHRCLHWAASGQHGYFTSAQAQDCGFSRSLLSHQTKSGRYIRVRRGLYRLRDYPSFHREDVVIPWLALGKDSAVVSHESALDLLELSDVIPRAVHLTIPRSKRNLPKIPGTTIHTTSRPFGALDIVVRDGIRLTSGARTILDSAEWGTAPEQIEMAIQQAIARRLTTRTQLARDASDRSQRVQELVASALR